MLSPTVDGNNAIHISSPPRNPVSVMSNKAAKTRLCIARRVQLSARRMERCTTVRAAATTASATSPGATASPTA